MIRISLITATLFLAVNLFAQKSFEFVPEHWDFEGEEDFEQYETIVLEAIEVLSSTPVETGNLDRNRAIKFINDWGMETPTIIIIPFSRVAKPIFKDIKNEDKKERYGVELFMSYYSAMIKHLLENEKSELKDVQLAGIESVIKLYKNNYELMYDSEAVVKYIQLQQSGKLEKWVEKRITRRDIKAHDCYQDESCTKREKYIKRNPAAYPEF